MKRIKKIFFSTRTMAVLLFLFGLSMAIATFAENDFDTATAKTLVYNSKWFELLMLWLILIFAANIKTYRLFRWSKWPVLMLHLAFIVMFIGGAVTRYFSFEGQMPIKTGETSNKIISNKTYFILEITDGQKALRYDKNAYSMSHFNGKNSAWPLKRTYKQDYFFGDKKLTLKSLDYVPTAKDSIQETPSGRKILEITTISKNGRESVLLGEGETKNAGGTVMSFNNPTKGSLQLVAQGNHILLTSPYEGAYMNMTGQGVGVVTDSALLKKRSGHLEMNQATLINFRTLYTINNTSFIITKPAISGKVVYYKGDKSNPMEASLPDAITVELSSGNEKDTLIVLGGPGVTGFSNNTKINGMDVSIGFGSKFIYTPFSIRCDQFIIDRYPGSTNPSSYKSELTVIDNRQETPHSVYMNNVMDYHGYRFFQAGYFPDESGTILSVNADRWGTHITYLGYLLLFAGLIATLFWKGTHFWNLNQNLKRIHKKTLVLIPILFFAAVATAQQPAQTNTTTPADSAAQQAEDLQPANLFAPASELENYHYPINYEIANKFGHLLIQDFQGRMKPLNTLALEMLRKIYKKDKIGNTSAEQWFLSMQLDPDFWSNQPIIKVAAKGGEKLAAETKAGADGYTSFVNLIDLKTREYLLNNQYTRAFSKRQAERTNYDKEVINITERYNVFNNIVYGYYTKIIPVKNDANESWTSWIYSTEENPANINKEALALFTGFFNGLRQGMQHNEWQQANKALKVINDYQHQWGKDVMPSQSKINIEVLYNHLNIFLWLMISYSLLGVLLVILAFAALLSSKDKFKRIVHAFTKMLLGLMVIAFSIHITGLAIRWYLSGHAPWSNGYEAIVFISAIGLLSGLILYRNRNAFIPAAGALVAMIMMGFAHGGAMLDPQITPLEPVLKSYWLMVHVGIITSSYGFFGLSAIIALIVLILISIKPTGKIKNSITELTIVNDMAVTIGVFALTIGTFLGGIWANESWGRYWSWDPKETWAFISIIFYAIILHLRIVPGLRGKWAYNTASLWAIWSIIMTYFGVNYYLTGLHTYATGDPIPIPNWIYFTAAGITMLTIISYLRYKKLHLKKGNIAKKT